jgi:uncharacterized protein (TIGR02996 family)
LAEPHALEATLRAARESLLSRALRNVQLEEAIRRMPGDLDSYEIYADWLLENGEPDHGEAILFAVRRLRTGATDPLSVIAAEARLLQDRRRILGPLGDFGREAVECDLHLGFLHALRIYIQREKAATALRHGLTHRASAFLDSVGIHRKSRLHLPHVNEDRRTTEEVWEVLFDVKVPAWVRAVAVPLDHDQISAQLDALAHVRECSFPLRNHRPVATEIHRLKNLERLVFTSPESARAVQMESLFDCAPAFADIPRVHLAFDSRFGYDPKPLREALPNLTIGWHA